MTFGQEITLQTFPIRRSRPAVPLYPDGVGTPFDGSRGWTFRPLSRLKAMLTANPDRTMGTEGAQTSGRNSIIADGLQMLPAVLEDCQTADSLSTYAQISGVVQAAR